MSERSSASRSGGREMTTREAGARGVRQTSGRSDTRRSGTGSNGGNGAETPRGGKPGGADRVRERADRAAASPRVGAGRGRVTEGVRGGRRKPEADGTAALALEVTGLEVTAADPVATGRPKLLVAPPLPLRAPRATFAASVIAVVLAGVLGILLINTKTMEQSFRIDALQKQKAELDKQQQTLEQQLIQASNPGNLHAAARRLGLVMAESPAMIRLPDGKISRIPTPGRGQPGVTAQNGLNQNGAAQNGAAQNGAAQNGAGQNGAGQNGAGQNGAGQKSVDQNGPNQGGPASAGTAPAGTSPAGAGQ
ncbi:hypothetical protein [Actinoplanes sp. DH11]|uniref:hypothetical protein n=1 Tax=Actinoplanes sp. DH11 TaxID=2857011 RepID=UPI001E64A28F|nr:hypothetical protein [Actinoplanes sp. DH11]